VVFILIGFNLRTYQLPIQAILTQQTGLLAFRVLLLGILVAIT
jgi:hypothetical protein